MCGSQADPTSSSILGVLARCVAGEESAWRELHRTHYAVAWSFLARLGVPAEVIEDATQDVFMQVFRSLNQFRGEADFRTWLYRVCITEARKLRRRARLKHLLGELWYWTDFEQRVARQELPTSTEQRIEAALSQLSESERTAFVLYELEGLAGKEVAELVGCSEASLWRRLHYARSRFAAAVSAGPWLGSLERTPSAKAPR